MYTLDCDELATVLNRELPEWIRVLESREIPLKFPSISDSIKGIQYLVSFAGLESAALDSFKGLQGCISQFVHKADNYIEINHKSGSSRADLKRWVEEIRLKGTARVEILIKMNGGKSVRLLEVLNAIFNLTDTEKRRISVLKTEVNFGIGPFVPAAH